MMTKETLTTDQVQQWVGEFVKDWNADLDREDDIEWGDEQQALVTQSIVEEMNTDIKASQESNVPEILMEILIDESIIPDIDGVQEAFIDWFEKTTS